MLRGGDKVNEYVMTWSREKISKMTGPVSGGVGVPRTEYEDTNGVLQKNRRGKGK